MTGSNHSASRPQADRPTAPPRGRPAGSGPGGQAFGREASREARRRAAMVLEVLAGARAPADAAQALAVALPCYYQVEARALRGLLAACEAQPRGRSAPALEKEAAALRRDKQRLEREVLRQQALVRAAQRTVGLAPPAPRRPEKKTRVRRRVRALHAAARLQGEPGEGEPAAVAGAGAG